MELSTPRVQHAQHPPPVVGERRRLDGPRGHVRQRGTRLRGVRDAGPTFTAGTVCTIHGERCETFTEGYIFSLHVSNLSGVDARITQISVTSNDNPSLILFIANPLIPTTILSGYVQNWYLNVTSNGQVSPPFNATINISWRPDVTPTATPTLIQLPVHVSAVSECRSCTPDGNIYPD